MRDKLSRREDRALLKALRAMVLTQYPNPDRKDCPGTQVLHAIATKRISMLDPAHEHVVTCSPCFKELTQMRRALQRRQLFMWAIGTAGAAIVVLAVWTAYFRFDRLETPAGTQTAQTERPSESTAGVQSGEAAQPATPATNPSPEAKYEIAVLDLRHTSTTRAVDAETPNVEPVELRRGLLALKIQLPTGSDAGPYEVQITDSNQQPIRIARGKAKIENGITTLPINLDTRSIQPGEYEFAWRLGDFGWRHHLIRIR